jgi:hypothetical protein
MSPSTQRNHGFGSASYTLNDPLLGVAITPLILDERLTDDLHPWDGGEILEDLMLSFPRLRAVHSHRDRLLRALRAGDSVSEIKSFCR